jgi:rhodanese-related sulfurtransferase
MTTTAAELVTNAKSTIENLSTQQLAEELKLHEVVLIDLREQDERVVHGAIPGAVHVPRGMLEFCADPALPVHAEELHPSRRIVLYCAAGNRSALAALMLKAMGFPKVAHLDGGYAGWRQAGGAVEPAQPATSGPWAHLLER